jgi:hypothetical protein
MNTTVVIADTISRTVVELAFIGAGLKFLLAVAPRFQIAAQKAPQVQMKLVPETVAPDGQAPAANGSDPAKGAAVTT